MSNDGLPVIVVEPRATGAVRRIAGRLLAMVAAGAGAGGEKRCVAGASGGTPAGMHSDGCRDHRSARRPASRVGAWQMAAN